MSEFNPTTEDGLQAFRQHVVDLAMQTRIRYGLYIDNAAILKILDDRKVVRYPTTIVFDDTLLTGDEFAFAQQLTDNPKDGFSLHIHPFYKDLYEVLPLLIAYHIVAINYGPIATSTEAELFGATLLGMEIDAYYQAVCELADARFQ